MKLKKMSRQMLTFQKVQPSSRLLWVGLICSLPWFVGAQENISEPPSVSTEQKISTDENRQTNPSETVDAAANASVATPQSEQILAVDPAPVVKSSEPTSPAVEPAPVVKASTHTYSSDQCASPCAPEPVKTQTCAPASAPAPKVMPAKQVKQEKAPPLCRPYYSDAPAPLRSIGISTTGLSPLSNGKVSLEMLYWEGVEESLRYAMKNLTAATPSSPFVNQNWGYDPGARASIFIPLFYDEWDAGLTYTYFYSTPPATHVKDPEGDLLASLNFSSISSSPWQAATAAKGKWNLKMNVVDFEMTRPFVIGQALLLQPSMGGKACFIRQKVDVHYTYTLKERASAVPQSNAGRIRAHSSVWGVGPEIGCEMRFLIPKHISLSIKGAFSAMLGNFSGVTSYSDYANPDWEGLLVEKKTALFEVGQMQVGLSKWWRIKDASSLELTLGWESQIWWGQMRMNWWSTAVLPPEGSTLTVKGPFFRGAFNF